MDHDNDGIPSHQDPDSDDDGAGDSYEAGGTDLDGDGRLDAFQDIDNNGVDDSMADRTIFLIDTDSDGIPDMLDLDSDNDGLPDLEEVGAVDLNRDGRADFIVRGDQLPDTDGNGIEDIRELQLGQLLNDGPVRTGVTPVGCSVSSVTGFRGTASGTTNRINNSASIPAAFDPLLLMLVLIAASYLFVKRSIRIRQQQRQQQGQQKVAQSSLILGVSMVLASGCATQDSFKQLSEFKPRHAYAGLGGNLSSLDPDDGDSATWSVAGTRQTDTQVSMGLDINKPLSIEVHSANLGAARLGSATISTSDTKTM